MKMTMRSYLKIRFLILGIFLFSGHSESHSQSLSATVSRNPVSVSEQFQLTFTLNATGSGFTPPPLNDFLVLSGPNQSSNMQIMNGAVSQSLSYSYILQPKKEGTFKIESAGITSNGKVITSPPFTITVTAGTGSPGSAGQSQAQDDKSNISTGSVFIRVSTDKKQVFRGEAVTVTFKLYTNVQIVNYSITKLPSFTGFWSQDIEMPRQMTLYNETYNGVNYQVGEIKKVILYPQQSGSLTIDPMEGECVARIRVKRSRSSNPFDVFNDPFFSDPFFGGGGARDIPYAIKSDPVKISVKELPPGAPPSFAGSVGKFNLEVLTDRQDVKTNDAVNIRAKITGRGNLKLIDTPIKNIDEDIESYDPKITDNISVTEKGISGTRTFEHLLIPRLPGEYKIGPFEFSYFDPEKNTYVSVASQSFKLNVTAGKGDASAVIAGKKNDFRVIGRDIKFIKTATPEFSGSASGLFDTPLFYFLTILPIAGMFGLILYRNKYLKNSSDHLALKSRRATAIAKKRLLIAENYLAKNEINAFYDETGKALWTFLGDKLRIPVSELSSETAKEKMLNSGISQKVADEFLALIARCEYARFAGGSAEDSAGSDYEIAINLITSAENEIRSQK